MTASQNNQNDPNGQNNQGAWQNQDQTNQNNQNGLQGSSRQSQNGQQGLNAQNQNGSSTQSSNHKLTSLTTAQAKELQAQHGKNELVPQKKESFIKKVFHIICEPMFLLLLVAAVIYFILGEPRDGAIMLIFVVGIITIDVVQEWKTDKTLNALKDLSAPHVTVIRDGIEQNIASADLVPGDLMMIYEGVKIPADGTVLRCAALSVDESSLTGEADAVRKVATEDAPPSQDYWRKDYCYAGTLVTQGSGIVVVDKIGAQTEYGKIGANIAAAPQEDAPLQKQTDNLVKTCAIIAGVLFLLVGIFTWMNLGGLEFTDRLTQAILSGVTLAMAMIPEEFPVILTVFLSLGAWRLAKKNSLVRRLPSVETLGAVSVLCTDKTGTITLNQMTVQDTWVKNGTEPELLETMGLGCAVDTYDPMEKAMLRCCDQHGISADALFANEFVNEYAFTDELKMMGQVWRKEGQLVIAAKGSPERIMTICDMSPAEAAEANTKIEELSSQGLRVIAVATGYPATEADVPENITDCHLQFLGLIGLADPPREGVENDVATCKRAGIRVVMITGDNGITASAIANKVGIPTDGQVVTGDQLDAMTDEELCEVVKTCSIFSRVIPEHKMRIVKAFKHNGEIVAMTGDGVNDAPALKYADIGIAMGQRGSEVSREAADLILMDDNFHTIVETVKDGRRIYDNIRKAVGYVFTIHIPIAFAALLAPFLGVGPALVMLLPIHVVLLEVLIDPTCSIVLERQPAERDIMDRAPRSSEEKMLTGKLLTKAVLQGLVLFAASFGSYYALLMADPSNADAARAMGLAVIMLGNLFLVQVNSSDVDFALTSAKRLIKDRIMWAVNIGTIILLAVVIYSPAASFLKMAPLSATQMLTALGLAAVSVLWFELVKAIKKLRAK